ncbi:MAG: DUF3368 domain-containing protein [Symploca sp. SIO1B1]|nr:DUF3368 domain-containing protein [Symploca sp. SIO1A3]NES00773.1 DUF3368 domain-containing protein [Symploca sp. SIO1B1]
MIVVSNTSPISNLAAIGQLELLEQLYGNVIIPPTVYQELINSGDTDPGTLAVKTLDWIKIQPITESTLVETLQTNLDPGEAEAIALAVELNAQRLIIDERKGRNAAIEMGLRVTGLLGILLAAKQQGYIPLVEPILDNLIDHGFWVHEKLYLEVLHLAGE